VCVCVFVYVGISSNTVVHKTTIMDKVLASLNKYPYKRNFSFKRVIRFELNVSNKINDMEKNTYLIYNL
jgi:hypothetical protein